MKILSRASLRQMLTLPYVLLVLLAAAVIGLLSYRAGSDTVDTLSDHVLNETVNRIAQAVDKHVAGSEAVLETAFPSGMPAPASVKDDLESLRTRLWLATTIHREANNYAYYGNNLGQFVGLWRFSEQEAELRLRTEANTARTIYRFTGIRGELRNPVVEERLYDPRERPWYKAGQMTHAQTWTAIYIDFKTLQLVSTRARRVDNGRGDFSGVVATDLSMEHLNDFLKSLRVSANGFAFIVEADGNLVATSRGPHIRKGAGDDNTRLNAAASDDPLIAATYKAVKALTERGDAQRGVRTSYFTGPDGDTVQAGYARLRDKAGLDWIVAVAVPRNDFMQKVTDNVQRTVWMALAACALIVLIGYVVLRLIAKDLRSLARAAASMGDGVTDHPIPVHRDDEIGELAKAFAGMQRRLFTDRLTGIANREAMVRRMEDRILLHRRRGDSRPFAVLFIDMNGFKQINDRFGHDIGDRVLVEIGQRLGKNLRDSDLAGRFGGDEFVVLVDQVDNRADALTVRGKIERVLDEPFQSLIDVAPDAATFAAGAAIGIAVSPDEGLDVETLLKRADKDMYERKQVRGGVAASL